MTDFIACAILLCGLFAPITIGNIRRDSWRRRG